MTTIDHRILIPAAPDAVWDYVSDISRNSKWQVDCREVMFLTSRRDGPGLRWRYSSPDGHEFVVSVSAWYNGLGYEYYFVDGVPYRENKGRIRLQEIPEGTIVQWTFSYELGGMLGGVRNALGVSRQIDHTIAESLKTLWQQLKQTGATARSHEAKSLMRDAPDVQARSAYQPRHMPPSSQTPTQPQRPVNPRLAVEPPVTDDDAQKVAIVREPPVAVDDTRPIQIGDASAEVTASDIPPDIEGEPEFLNELVDLSRFEPPRELSDTRPIRPITPEQLAAAVEPTPPSHQDTEPLPPALPGYPTAEPPRGAQVYEAPTVETVEKDAEATAAELELGEETAVEAAPPADETMTEMTTPAEPPATEEALTVEVKPPPEPMSAIELPPAPSQVPPETKSIWEVFGLPRPSETQTTQAVPVNSVTPEPAAAEPTISESLPLPDKIVLPDAPSHTGLRVRLRRKSARVRRP